MFCAIPVCARGCRWPVAALGFLLGVSAHAAPPGIESIGLLPGTGFFKFSGNGQTICGARETPNPNQPVRWTRSDGWSYLPAPSNLNCFARAVSADGRTITGTSSTGTRWIDGIDTPMPSSIALPLPEGISADGRTVVGLSSGGIFRWNVTTGTTLLPAPQNAGQFDGGVLYDVSADGNTCVGSYSINSSIRPIRWTQAGGTQVLTSLTTRTFDTDSYDGSVLAGGTSSGLEYGGAFRYTDSGGTTILPGLGTSTKFHFGDMSADGSIIVGSIGITGSIDASLWTPAGGTQLMTSYLSSHGVNLAGWSSITYCFGVSDDNTMFAGNGTYNGSPAVWIATVPAPSTLIPISVLAISALSRRRRS